MTSTRCVQGTANYVLGQDGYYERVKMDRYVIEASNQPPILAEEVFAAMKFLINHIQAGEKYER